MSSTAEPVTHGKQRARGHGAFDPKLECPSQQVKEFPNENLTVPNKKLFCNACREEVGLKTSVVHNHVRLNKHKLGTNLLVRKDVTERDIVAAFKRTQQEEHPKSKTLPEEARVVRVLLCPAPPLNKLAHLSGLLEKNTLCLTDKWLTLCHCICAKNFSKRKFQANSSLSYLTGRQD